MSNLIFYIDTAKSPRDNPVSSTTYSSPDLSNLGFSSGDRFPVTFVFFRNGIVDSTIATTGSNSSSFYLAIGDAASNTPLTSTNRFFISQSYGVTCSLDLSTDAITGSFGSEEEVSKTIQLSVYSPSGSANKQTYMLRKVSLYNVVDL